MISKKVAKDLDMPAKDVRSIMNAFYRELRADFKSLEYPSINVPGLGIFKAKIEKLLKFSYMLKRDERHAEKVYKLKTLVKRLDIQTARNRAKFFKKKEYYADKNMEK